VRAEGCAALLLVGERVHKEEAAAEEMGDVPELHEDTDELEDCYTSLGQDWGDHGSRE
jgi:hypothetical protein